MTAVVGVALAVLIVSLVVVVAVARAGRSSRWTRKGPWGSGACFEAAGVGHTHRP